MLAAGKRLCPAERAAVPLAGLPFHLPALLSTNAAAACLERPGRSCSGSWLVCDAVKFRPIPYLTELNVLSQLKAFHFTCCCALNEILCKRNLKSCYFLFVLTKPKIYCNMSNFVPLNFCSLGHQRKMCIPTSAGVH